MFQLSKGTKSQRETDKQEHVYVTFNNVCQSSQTSLYFHSDTKKKLFS